MRSPEEIIRELEQEIRRRDKREEGKTMIGTCGDCEEWARFPGRKFGKCKERNQEWKFDDGCKFWKPKQQRP